jgi:hypothetical protein
MQQPLTTSALNPVGAEGNPPRAFPENAASNDSHERMPIRGFITDIKQLSDRAADLTIIEMKLSRQDSIERTYAGATRTLKCRVISIRSSVSSADSRVVANLLSRFHDAFAGQVCPDLNFCP